MVRNDRHQKFSCQATFMNIICKINLFSHIYNIKVKSLKQRIALLEEEAAVYKGTLPLQSQSSGASETSL
ncbi:colorectal mutant cancer protein-like isoform X3 [Vespula squamosa]|uniref:Colorectal mutant cancer protein-like isoform X3 n=1 Tax=Vespula squamosa TaxID=30214 RepID=A0ABD2B1N1_VESSQ